MLICKLHPGREEREMCEALLAPLLPAGAFCVVAEECATPTLLGVCDIAVGLTFQLLPLLMERRHVAAWVIGLNAAMSPLGTIISGPPLPPLVARIGSKRLVYAITAIIVLSLLAFMLTASIAAWFIDTD